MHKCAKYLSRKGFTCTDRIGLQLVLEALLYSLVWPFRACCTIQLGVLGVPPAPLSRITSNEKDSASRLGGERTEPTGLDHGSLTIDVVNRCVFEMCPCRLGPSRSDARAVYLQERSSLRVADKLLTQTE